MVGSSFILDWEFSTGFNNKIIYRCNGLDIDCNKDTPIPVFSLQFVFIKPKFSSIPKKVKIGTFKPVPWESPDNSPSFRKFIIPLPNNKKLICSEGMLMLKTIKINN